MNLEQMQEREVEKYRSKATGLQEQYELPPTPDYYDDEMCEYVNSLITEVWNKAIKEEREKVLHQLNCCIDNVSYAPSKPSDYRAWQDGFQTAYQQATKVIRYGHTNIKDDDYQRDLMKRIDVMMQTDKTPTKTRHYKR